MSDQAELTVAMCTQISVSDVGMDQMQTLQTPQEGIRTAQGAQQEMQLGQRS